MNRKEDQTRQQPSAFDEAEDVLRSRKSSLIDSIPDAPLSSSAEEEVSPEDIDYGELIERELILPGREGSVFKEDVDEPPRTDFEVLKEIMDELGLGRPVPKKPVP